MQLENDWLETLAALKRKDPKIYDKNAKFYHSEGNGPEISSIVHCILYQTKRCSPVPHVKG